MKSKFVDLLIQMSKTIAKFQFTLISPKTHVLTLYYTVNTIYSITFLSTFRNKTYRVHKEDFEIFGFSSQFRTPGYFTLFNHLHGIDIDQTWSSGEEQHATAGKQTFAFVDKALFQNHLTIGKGMPFI